MGLGLVGVVGVWLVLVGFLVGWVFFFKSTEKQL